MATTTYIEQNGVADINAMYDVFANALVAKGWTRTTINSFVGPIPLLAGRSAKEDVFQAPGDSVDTGGFYISMARSRDQNSVVDGIKLWCFTSLSPEGFVTITDVSRSGNTYTFTTSAAHGFEVGEFVRVAGFTDEEFNNLDPGTATAMTTVATVPTATTFTMTLAFATIPTATSLSSQTATAYAPKNIAGNISDVVNSGLWLTYTTPGAAANVVGGVDEFALTGAVFQSGSESIFYIGGLGRGHIPAEFSQTLTTTSAITGAASAQVIPVVETPLDLIVGQPIDIIDNGTERIHRTRLDAIGPGNQITAIVPMGEDFLSGAKIGWDPMPIVAMGTTTASPIDDYSSLTKIFAYSSDGTRTWAQNDGNNAIADYNDIESSISSQAITTAADGGAVSQQIRSAWDMYALVTSTSGGAVLGRRGPLRNCIGFVPVGVMDYDFGYSGRTLPDDIYKLFPSLGVDGAANRSVGYGPNVPGATPLP